MSSEGLVSFEQKIRLNSFVVHYATGLLTKSGQKSLRRIAVIKPDVAMSIFKDFLVERNKKLQQLAELLENRPKIPYYEADEHATLKQCEEWFEAFEKKFKELLEK